MSGSGYAHTISIELARILRGNNVDFFGLLEADFIEKEPAVSICFCAAFILSRSNGEQFKIAKNICTKIVGLSGFSIADIENEQGTEESTKRNFLSVIEDLKKL